jgi:predicted nucleic acid-binding Zn ribbon protein
MSRCSYCGQEVPEARKVCKPCRDNLAVKIWKRQMRTYSIIVLVGVGLLVYAYFQFSAHHYHIEDAPMLLKVTTLLGGLGLMGGLFGLGLAVLFHLWHGKAR